MSFENIVNKAKSYKSLYSEALTKCNQIRDNNELADHAKVSKIRDVVIRYNPQIEAAAGRVIDEIDKTMAEIEQDRRKAIEAGFAMADQIALAERGIRSGAYGKGMVVDMIEIYKDNPPMLEAIRNAVKDNINEAVKSLYSKIPADKSEEQLRGLANVKKRIKAAPKLDTQEHGDWSVGLWKVGIGIDGIIDFILGLEDISSTIEEDVMVEPEPLDPAAEEAIRKIFIQPNYGTMFGE